MIELTQTVSRDGKTIKNLINTWHSTLSAPIGWKVAFMLLDESEVVGVSTWGHPTARHEDQIYTLEHTRMALCDKVPRNTGSWFLARNREWIRKNMPNIKRLIAYVNLENHTGIVYRADNWKTVYKKINSGTWKSRDNRKGNEAHLRAKFERVP